MPYVNVITEKKCTNQEQNVLKAGIAKALKDVLDKEEQGVLSSSKARTDFFVQVSRQKTLQSST